MNRVLNSIGYRIKPFLEKKNDSRIRENFSCSKKTTASTPTKILYDVQDTGGFFNYKDETWNYIKNIGFFMWNDLFSPDFMKRKNPKYFIDNKCANDKVQYYKNEIKCFSENRKNDWIYLKFNRSLKKPYVLSFQAKLETENSEFQIAFNYKDIGKRYRFNLKDNNLLSFEVVSNGCFVNDICSAKISLELGRYYDFQIHVNHGSFQYFVDGTEILSVQEKNSLLNGDGLVFILWDSLGKPIDVCYKEIKLYELC
ncbi:MULTISPECIES: hypothetical protein [Zobellia]|uniref:hypothetical protein n=1 Tax=Zobellia TaxID=112040 RepID=UPI001C066DE3|nr:MULTISPECIES: hypothetical protein [unclassified Zobellia]MBU2975493.1 hypothetical protein [Zobellia sp. B3R18]MDO6817592.1 hypothetical protein [Zobellia sp. 1_MG-2023]